MILWHIKYLPMRKGIADTYTRTEVSKNIIDRFTEHMATVEEKTRLGELLSEIAAPLIRGDKRTRALDAFGKDKDFRRAVSDPAFNVSGITNREF